MRLYLSSSQLGEHPETAVLGEVAAEYERTNRPYLPLRDGQALVVDGDRSRIV